MRPPRIAMRLAIGVLCLLPLTSCGASATSGVSSLPSAPAPHSSAESDISPSETDCSQVERTWNTSIKADSSVQTASPLVQIQATRYMCFDRLLFSFNTAEVTGFNVRYLPVYHRHDPVLLHIVIHAPAVHHWQPAVGLGGDALGHVVFKGIIQDYPTFDAVTTGQHPFHVHRWAGENGQSFMAIDVSHK